MYVADVDCFVFDRSGVPIHGTGNPMGQSLDPNDVILDRTKNFNSTRQPNIVDPSPMKHDEVENLTMESLMRSNEGYAVGQQNQQGSHVSNNFGSLEDLACVMVKQVCHHIHMQLCIQCEPLFPIIDWLSLHSKTMIPMD